MNRKDDYILVVDDDESIRFTLSETLERDGYRVKTASNGIEAIELIKKENFTVVVIDVRMPKLNGLEALIEINRLRPDIYPIILTAYGKENLDVSGIGELAFSYLTKPFDLTQLRTHIKQALERSKADLDGAGSIKSFPFKEIIGEGPAIRQIRKLINKVAESNLTVLVLGESGTGKELVARAVHACSPRANKPLIPIACSAIPETLLESELFGYDKGAFTDAKESKPGKVELANEGTIFLDEIGDMGLPLQSKLLRVLEEREVERLGSTTSKSVDIRVIAATNKDLFTEVKKKKFREDLYYRLNVLSLYLPPLRKRKEDIPLILEHYIKKFNETLNRTIKSISIEALEVLVNYSWPGNIRELENILQGAMVLETTPILTKESLKSLLKEKEGPKEIELGDLEVDGTLSLADAMKEVNSKIEKKLIKKALTRNNGNRETTAQELGISRKTLYNKMKEYNLED